ncbi:MAG: malate dehydrogenase (oxaloacetate-decarboxylating)(NADP+) [Gammaproteobacteria bacterium]|jgi:malate dehydrogenase (oxaloacetate-decarboxylating)(NADP+)
MSNEEKKEKLRESALEYHRSYPPGKLAIQATKPLANQHDLALAYTPGVAIACEEIEKSPEQAAFMTSRANLVAVITNGTAVLGLGAIGPLAAKPVMEGKAVLFKKFSGIDVFDIEIDERDPDKLVEIIASLEPTFGGINLEDIKAPECFMVEQKLKERLKIPVFHDDQHGTAIIVGAAVINGLRIVNKDIGKVKLAGSGAGAAAIACLDLLVGLGMKRENIFISDSRGIIWEGRDENMDPSKARYAQKTDARVLDDVMEGADIFLGLSGPGVVNKEMVRKMAKQPIILALSNPDPEILPEDALEVRPDAIMATGRSDYPNQVNNVLCFPYIFRGALDVGATTINDEMKIACVHAIADLATVEPSDIVAKAYGGSNLKFGPDYLIPKPFDPRLIVRIAPAVAKAAMESGVATREIPDLKVYRQKLLQFIFQTGTLMNPVFDQAKHDPKKVVYAEGEHRNVLQAVQQVVDEGIAIPILIGRPNIITKRIKELGLRIQEGKDFEIVSPLYDKRFNLYWKMYHELMGRNGVSPAEAKTIVRTKNTVIAALMLKRNEVDAMLCGAEGRFINHLRYIREIIDMQKGVSSLATVIAVVLPSGLFFLCDTHVTPNPTVDEIVANTLLAAKTVQEFGIKPRIALLSHSSFGSRNNRAARKMRQATQILRDMDTNLVVEGEMHADAALSDEIRNSAFPNSRLKGKANLFIMPNIDAAHITYNLLKMVGGGVTVGPILVGNTRPAHILTSSVTVRGIINMTALAVVEAQDQIDQIALC